LPPGLPSQMDGTGAGGARPYVCTTLTGNPLSDRLRWAMLRRAERSWRRFYALPGSIFQDERREKEPPSFSLRRAITPSFRQGRRERLGSCSVVVCLC